KHSCNEGSDIEIEKIFSFYGIGTMQITSAACRTARPRQIRRRARHAKIAKSVATHSIEYIYIRGEATKKVNKFFIEPQFIKGEQIGLVYMEKEIKKFLL